MTPKVDGYIRKNKQWKDQLDALRAIALACPLVEEIKWRIPVYTFDDKNVLALTALKESCTLSFFKGALLKDPKGILEKPGENTRSGRVIRFTSVQEITALGKVLKAYIVEAIELEKSGAKVDFKKDSAVELPAELLEKFWEMPEFKTAFHALTPGRQRGYLLFFSGAKQSATRASRIEKHIDRIFEGKGMHD